jgi:hypothetical protein
MPLTDSHKALLREVYPCTHCQSFGFKGHEDNKPYFKFPPTIGAEGEAPLLFVGINPRISSGSHYPGNEDLHNRLMGSKDAFAALAQNRDGRDRYIAPGCAEKFYHRHMKVSPLRYKVGIKPTAFTRVLQECMSFKVTLAILRNHNGTTSVFQDWSDSRNKFVANPTIMCNISIVGDTTGQFVDIWETGKTQLPPCPAWPLADGPRGL